MDIGTYTNASAGILEQLRLEITNNNLANANTPGFKRQVLVSRQTEFGDTLASELNDLDPFAKGDQQRYAGAIPVKTYTDFSVGSIKTTNNPLDIALRGPNQFFAVTTPSGELYTRAGNLTLNSAAQISTPDGHPLVGDSGPIAINEGIPKIAANGMVMVNGLPVGKLRVVDFVDPQVLSPVGSSTFKINGNATPRVVEEPNLVVGSLEMSNVSAIQSMLDLIKSSRGFELYQKSAKSIDEMNQQSTSQLGNNRS